MAGDLGMFLARLCITPFFLAFHLVYLVSGDATLETIRDDFLGLWGLKEGSDDEDPVDNGGGREDLRD